MFSTENALENVKVVNLYNAVMRFVNVMIDEYKTFVLKSIEM